MIKTILTKAELSDLIKNSKVAELNHHLVTGKKKKKRSKYHTLSSQ